MLRITGFNRIIALLTVLALFGSLCACSTDNSEGTEPTTIPAKYSIGVIQSYDDTASDNTYQGFTEAFTDKGYYQSEFHTLSVVNCGGDKTKCSEAAEQFVSDGVDLIFAIGEPAAVAAAKATDTIPVIFSGVSDPIEAGLLKSCETPDKNVTGVSDLTPVYQQLELVNKLLPDAVKVSSIYKITDENSILISTLAENAAKNLALDYSAFTAADEKQLDTCIENALEDCDVLYFIEDELTTKNAEKIINEATKKKIPVISTSEELLSLGCIATSVPDYSDLGYNAGELALILIKGLRDVSDLSVEYPDVCIDKINSQVAQSLGIDITALEDAVIIN